MSAAKNFIVGSALALGTIGCSGEKKESTKQEQPQQTHVEQHTVDPENTHVGILAKSGVHFTNANGDSINPAALAAKLNGKYTSISFMFATCPLVCPTTIRALTGVAEQNPDLSNVVFAVNPPDDALVQENGKTKLENRIEEISGGTLRTSGPNANVMVIYPVGKGATREEQLQAGRAASIKTQDEFNSLFRGNDEIEGHSATIMYFDPSGQKITQITPRATTSYDKKAEEISERSNKALKEEQRKHGIAH